MKKNLFISFLSILIILCLQKGVHAEFCGDDASVGKCFEESIVPLVIGSTTTGFVFGFFLVILSLCLFYKTKIKNGEIAWVHDREPSNWVRECEHLGIVNRRHEARFEQLQFEARKQGLGDNKPQHFVSDRSLYSERATTTAFPSPNTSEMMGARDELQDIQDQGETGLSPRHYRAPASEEKERRSEYETPTSRNTHSAHILHHKKFGKITKKPSFDGSTTTSIVPDKITQNAKHSV